MTCINKCMKKSNLAVGDRIHMWTLLEKLGKIKTGGDIFWLCECECGAVSNVRTTYLLKNKSKSCFKCSIKPKPYSKDQIPDVFWKKILRGAKIRNIQFQLTQDEAYEVFIRQNKKCKLSGVEIRFPINGSDYKTCTASLDRIDSKMPYTKDNIQWVHKHINVMKNVFTQDCFIDFCKKVAETANTRDTIQAITTSHEQEENGTEL
jgi:hypothetical protein